MEVISIVAATAQRVIGKDNDLLWHLPVDMKFFRENTMGHPVIMGRKNYESIPDKYRPLSGRLNVVLSRNADYPVDEGVWLRTDLESSLDELRAAGEQKVFVIGGGQIYDLALRENLIDRMLITWVDAHLEGDAFFPEFDNSAWSKQILMTHPADERHAYKMQFCEYSKKG